eukprot:2559_1
MSLKDANNVMWQKQPKQPSNPDLPPLEGDTPPPQHSQKNDKSVPNIASDDARSCTDTANTSSSTFSGNNSDHSSRNMIIASTPQIVVYHNPTNINNNHYSTQQYLLSSQQSPLFVHSSEYLHLPLLNTRKTLKTVHNLPITLTKKRRAITPAITSNKRRKLNPHKTHSESEDDDPTLYCICRKKDDGSKMVECDYCNEWFHIRCINVSKARFKKIKKGASFDCPTCHNKGSKKHKDKTKKKRKKRKKNTKKDKKKKRTKKKKKETEEVIASSCEERSNTSIKEKEQRACIMDSMLGLTSDEENNKEDTEKKVSKQSKKVIDLRLYRMNIDPTPVDSQEEDDDMNQIKHSAVNGKLRYNVWA